MTNELVINEYVNNPYLLNDNRERQVKVLLQIHPSDEVRSNQLQRQVAKVGTDVCIVIDVSSSMRDIIGGEVTYTGQKVKVEGSWRNLVEGGITKLDVAISAVEKLVPLLREEDTLSLIAYEDNSHVIFQGLKNSNEKEILSNVGKCREFKGNTNISGALREARILLNQYDKGRPKRIIFLTDGRPVGDTEEKGIQEGQLLAESNITIDGLGIGEDFNYDFIQRLVEPSKGRTNIITMETAEKIFEQLFKNSQQVLATNLEMKLTFSPQVRVSEHYRGVPENMYLGKVRMEEENRTYTLKLGQIESDQRYDYYFLVTVPPQEGYTQSFRLFKVDLSYYLPGIESELQKTSKNVMVEFVNNAEYAKMTSGEVERGYTQAEIMRLLQEAEEFQRSEDKINTINRYEEIISKCNGLGNVDDAEMYINVLNEYKASGNITLSEINAARQKSSSKVSDSGQLPPVLTKEKSGLIFGTRRRR